MPHRTGTGIALLADPTRRRIIALVAFKPRRPSAIARDLGVHRSTATHQLRLLEEAGLILRRRTLHDGRGVLYILAPGRVGHVLAWLAGTEDVALGRNYRDSDLLGVAVGALSAGDSADG